ncbi:unnamed protein product [Ixodes pacificus]
MRIACVLMGLAVLVALAESSPLKQQTCVQGLNLSEEETATMERVQQLQTSGRGRIRSQEDVDRLIDQEAPSRAVANSLKPKVAAMVVSCAYSCTAL